MIMTKGSRIKSAPMLRNNMIWKLWMSPDSSRTAIAMRVNDKSVPVIQATA